MNITPGCTVYTVGPAGQRNALTDRIGCGRVESLHDETIGGTPTACAYVAFHDGKEGSWPVAQLRVVGYARPQFDGETLTVPAGNPVWVKVGGMTLQLTPAGCGDCDHLTIDAWRADDDSMAEPWTVVFDGQTVEVR